MISIVVPVFNEEENLKLLYSDVTETVKDLDKNYEILFIDDGSTDKSFDILKEFEKKNKNIRIFSFRKNQGKAEALTFGFQKAKGDYIITLDADLQDKPEEISRFLDKLKEGYDVVCGWRKERRDNFKKLLSSKIFNTTVKFFWGLRIHDYNCGFKAYTSEAAKSLSLYGGLHRFIPILTFQNGFRITEIPVDHEKRHYGKSKYSFSKIFKDLPDMFTILFLTRYSSRPLHFFSLVGGILFIFGVFILSYLSILRFQGEMIGRRPLLFLGMLLVLSGLQTLLTGFIADLVANLSQKSKNKPMLKYSSED